MTSSVVQTLNRQQFQQNIELAVVEVAVFNWINMVLDDLRRQLQRNMIAPDRARRVWKVERGCYECCMKALRERRLP